MNEKEFDALLTAACGEARQEELAAAGMAAQKTARRKGLRAVLVAAVACMMLSIGVSAAWPQLQTWIGDSRMNIATVGEGAAAQSELAKMEFDYLPKGMSVVWDEESVQNGMPACEITNGKTGEERQNFFVEKRPLTENFWLKPVDENGNELEDDTRMLEILEQNTMVLESFADLTEEVFDQYGFLAWPGDNCYYVVMHGEFPAAEALQILRNMK